MKRKRAGRSMLTRAYCGNCPSSMARARSRRWKSGSTPPSFCASFQTSECTPSIGFQWNFTKVDFPGALTRRNVCTPKPCIMRKLRGIARSDMIHMIMCIARASAR
jgi:hypothetical protein